MDVLAEVLRSVRLTGGLFLEAHFTAPWCVTGRVTAEDCKPFLVKPAQVIAYHFVLHGKLFLSIEGDCAIEVQAGEIALLPRNDSHMMASAAGLQPVKADDLIKPSPSGGLSRICHGGGGDPTHLVCGFLCSEETYNPLIASLPRVLKLDVRHVASREWIEASVRFAAGEVNKGTLASSTVLSRLSELLLMEAVRCYSLTLSDDGDGWLMALKDPHIGRALALMHQDVSAHWSAGALAGEVAMSRSAFMSRFKTCVGVPPIRYMTVLRMKTAKLQLLESAKTVTQVAHSVGYESEEAFSRAFKREFGLSPLRWREQRS